MKLDKEMAYLLLGTNLGNRAYNLQHAITVIDSTIGEVFAKSGIYETDAWGKTDQPSFLNQAIGIYTNLPPMQLLDKLLAVEQQMGRVRLERWGERLIDIDIIFYGNEIIADKKLHLPHQEMHNRRFVLEPLNEIAADVEHPVLRQKVSNILTNLTDNLSVKKI